MYRRKKTEDEKWADIIAFVIPGGFALGVYGLTLLFGQNESGSMFIAIVVFVVIFIPVYCFRGMIYRKITGKKKFSYKKSQLKPQVQKRISFDEFKYCIKCGSEMKKDLKICTKCGQPFQV